MSAFLRPGVIAGWDEVLPSRLILARCCWVFLGLVGETWQIHTARTGRALYPLLHSSSARAVCLCNDLGSFCSCRGWYNVALPFDQLILLKGS